MAVTSGSLTTNEVSYVYNSVTIKTSFTLAWAVSQTNIADNEYTIDVTLTQNTTPSGYSRTVYGWYVTIDNATTSQTYSSGSTGTDGTTWGSFSQSITMGDDGTKSVTFKVGVKVGTTSSYNCTQSTSFTLGTIPRYSTLTIPTLTMGSSATITVTQALSTFYSVVGITYNNNYTEYSAQTGSSFTVTFTPADITSSVTTSDHADAVIQVFTYYDSTLSTGGLITTETAAVYVPSGIVPSVSIDSITEANSSLSGIPFIVGYSLLTVAFTFTGNSGSTLASSSLTCGSETVTGTGTSLTTTVPLASTSNTVTVTVTDSRGRTATATQTVSATAYTAPVLTLDVTRTDSNYDADPLGTYVSAKGQWSYGTFSGNSATITITDGTSTVTYTPSTNPNTSWTQIATFSGVSIGSEVTITATITDAVSSSAVSATVSRGVIPLSPYMDGTDVGITLGRMSNDKDFHAYMDGHVYDGYYMTVHGASSTDTYDITEWVFKSMISTLLTPVTTSSVITKTSGTATLDSSSVTVSGNMYQVHLTVTGTSTSISRGTDIFKGTISSSYYPPHTVSACMYYSSRFLIATINTSGDVVVRFMGYAQGTTDTTMTFTFTWIN